ncbi:MAG: phosphonate ABC transporter, permease protein PhnE [Anaerolineae bacterium]|nr:phosphonate ABC transporter, permease protein PhnE [Anaerolineae bacterium]
MTTSTTTITPTAETPQPRRSKSLVLALILAIIPGLGHLYVGKRGRGLLILFTVPSLILLTLWRMNVGGANYVGPAAAAPSDAQLRAVYGMAFVLFLFTFLIYAWSLWDVVRCVRGQPLPARLVFIAGTLAFFIIGWDVTQINVEKALTRLPEIRFRLLQLAWPWDNAFVRGEERIQAAADIDTPCGETMPDLPPEVPGAPYIDVNVRCGDMAGPVGLDGTRNPPGTLVQVEGRGFRPNKLVEAWWQPPGTSEFRPRAEGRNVTVIADANGAFNVAFNIPNFTIPGGNAPDVPLRSRLIMRQIEEEGDLRPSENLRLALGQIMETIFLALMATFVGVILAVPLSFLAARNLMSGSPLTLLIYTLVRLLMNIVRSIEPLIWAVIAIVWVGLGPFAGTVALSLHSIASLGKLYSEAIESIDPGPLEAIQSTGANWLQVIVYAVIPQVIPPFVSFTVYRWDVNIRSSTIIGAVGGGGIGFLLIQWIRLSDYDSAGIAVWLIAIVVSVLDYVSSQVRTQFV